MFERPYDDAEPAILSEDDSAVVRREISQMLSALHHLSQSLAPGEPVDRNLIYNILFVSESRLAQVGTITGVETNSAAEQTRRNTDIRTAHQRVRQLEAQLGAAVTPEQTKLAVANLSRRVQAWWRNSGLGHARDVTFDSWGNMLVTLSCSLFGSTSLIDSDTPVSDKTQRAAWLSSLEAAGFVLARGHGNVGHIAACDASRQALETLVKRAIPSAQFQRISTRNGRDGVLQISEASFYVGNLDDLNALPAVVED